MLRSSVIDAFSGWDGASYPDLHAAQDQPYAPDDGVAVSMHESGDGVCDFVRVNAGASLGVVRWRPRPGLSETVTLGQHRVKLNFQLSGRAHYADAEGRNAFQVGPMTAGIMLHPAGVEKRESFGDAGLHAGVIVSCSGEYLESALDVGTVSFPAPLARFLRTGEAEFFYTELPLSLDMAQAVRALLACELRGRMRRLHAEAKALDLIGQCFSSLAVGEGLGRARGAVPSRDRERVEALRRHLDAEFMQVRSLDALAAELGTSDQRLAACFRQVVGVGVADYLHELRMSYARRLLADTARAITDIAYDMGYEYPGNFSTAFKRHFGLSPRQARRLGGGG